MTDSLELLSGKVGEVVKRLDDLSAENASLKAENEGLKVEILNLRKQYHRLMLDKNDQSEAVRARLVTLLDRLNQLESLTG
jgi:regulator of replication initiation timing